MWLLRVTLHQLNLECRNISPVSGQGEEGAARKNRNFMELKERLQHRFQPS